MILKKTHTISKVLLIFLVISVSTIWVGNLAKSDITTANLSTDNPLEVVDSFQKQKSEEIILTIDIFGYKVSPTNKNPIERDKSGILTIIQKKKDNTVDIDITLKFGKFTFLSIPVEKEYFFDLNRDYIIRYEIEDPFHGFFMEVDSLLDVSTINLAFDNGLCQFNYDGILNKGIDDFQLNPAFDPLISNVNFVYPKEYKLSLVELKQHILFHQENSLNIDNIRYLESLQSETILYLPVSYTDYGLVHENWIKYQSWVGLMQLPAQLPDYWETHTNIDIGVHRYHGSESQVKSDLQYYNRDQIQYFQGYVRDIKAYEMVCHGGDSWYLYQNTWWIFWAHTGTITPSEIRSLWYHTYDPINDLEIDVKPWNTIVFADVCHGYSDSTSGMAHAWVDYGAKAFIGATINVPIYENDQRVNDQFVGAFWEELCVNGGTIRSATIALCNNYGHGWNLGDEWKIMGDQYATLP